MARTRPSRPLPDPPPSAPAPASGSAAPASLTVSSSPKRGAEKGHPSSQTQARAAPVSGPDPGLTAARLDSHPSGHRRLAPKDASAVKKARSAGSLSQRGSQPEQTVLPTGSAMSSPAVVRASHYQRFDSPPNVSVSMQNSTAGQVPAGSNMDANHTNQQHGSHSRLSHLQNGLPHPPAAPAPITVDPAMATATNIASSSSHPLPPTPSTSMSSAIVAPVPQRRIHPLPEPDEQHSHPTPLVTAPASAIDPVQLRYQQSIQDIPQGAQQQGNAPAGLPRPSSFFGGLDGDQPRDSQTSSPPRRNGQRPSSFFGALDDQSVPSSPEEQPSRTYLRQAHNHLPPGAAPGPSQGIPRSVSQPPNSRHSPTHSRSSSASAAHHPHLQYQHGQPPAVPAVPGFASRSSFYGLDGPLSQQPSPSTESAYPSAGVGPSAAFPQSIVGSRARNSSGNFVAIPASRSSSQYPSPLDAGQQPYGTSQLQADYSHRRRTSSWANGSRAGSIYGVNAMSPNMGSSASQNGDNLSVMGMPAVPTLNRGHLKPGDKAALLSHQKTLELYRANVRKTNDPDVTYEFAQYMLNLARELAAYNNGEFASHESSEENLLAALNDHSGSPSPDPSMSFHSRSSGSSGELNTSSSGAGSTLVAPTNPTITNRKRLTSLHSIKTQLKDGKISPSRVATPTSAPVDDRRALVAEAISILRKNAQNGHTQSQYFLADCYARGFGTRKEAPPGSNAVSPLSAAPISAISAISSIEDPSAQAAAAGAKRGAPDLGRAFSLYHAAGKHGHAQAAFQTGKSFELGLGTGKDTAKAVQFYRRAAAASHPEAMYRLGMAQLKGELGFKNAQKEGFKWLKRVAELAETNEPADVAFIDPSSPLADPATRMVAVKALYDLAELHERGMKNVVYEDYEYAAELLARASELGHAPSAYKLGECYEYGRMGCPQDSALSIHYYNIAAQQNHPEACFALTAWYLVGSPGVLPQSDTEAYLWAKRAAETGLAKAEYAVGYFTEIGCGTISDDKEAMMWFRRAAEHGDKRAVTRLRALGQGKAGTAISPTSPFEKDNRMSKQSHKRPTSGKAHSPTNGQANNQHADTTKKADGDCVVM